MAKKLWLGNVLDSEITLVNFRSNFNRYQCIRVTDVMSILYFRIFKVIKYIPNLKLSTYNHKVRVSHIPYLIIWHFSLSQFKAQIYNIYYTYLKLIVLLFVLDENVEILSQIEILFYIAYEKSNNILKIK